METQNANIPRLTAIYLEYLQNLDTARFVEQVGRHYQQVSLIRLADAERIETRRAVALALGFLGNYGANSALGRLLLDSDRSVCLLAENSIKNVWPRDGSDAQRRVLRDIMRQISRQQYAEAVRMANILLEECPLFAEARNQRAIALFALEEFQDAIEDAMIVLDLNPYHFGAAIGMAHAHLQLREKEQAVLSFQHALRINPRLELVRWHLERIVSG